MSASFCDCVNQWEQAVWLQVLRDTKYLSLRTRGELWDVSCEWVGKVATQTFPTLSEWDGRDKPWRETEWEQTLTREQDKILSPLTEGCYLDQSLAPDVSRYN